MHNKLWILIAILSLVLVGCEGGEVTSAPATNAAPDAQSAITTIPLPDEAIRATVTLQPADTPIGGTVTPVRENDNSRATVTPVTEDSAPRATPTTDDSEMPLGNN
jgi:hypothetical protein